MTIYSTYSPEENKRSKFEGVLSGFEKCKSQIGNPFKVTESTQEVTVVQSHYD